MPDLKSMTVEERDALVYGPCEEDWKNTFPGGSRADAWCLFVEAWLLGYEHSARRLEEAQQKIVAQQAALKTYGQHLEDCLWATELPTGRGYFGCSCGFDTLEFTLPDDALAAHDAELTAKAKAEALEEFMLQFGDEDCPPRLVDDALAKAAEHRAKAGRKE